MYKIIYIKDNSVIVSNENKETKEIKLSDLDFAPNIDDEILFHEKEGRFIVSKVDTDTKNKPKKNYNINIGVYRPVTVNKKKYLLLTLLFGGIGVHKFYSKRHIMGLLYLIFSWTWIPFIVAVVELVSASLKKEDSDGNISI